VPIRRTRNPAFANAFFLCLVPIASGCSVRLSHIKLYARCTLPRRYTLSLHRLQKTLTRMHSGSHLRSWRYPMMVTHRSPSSRENKNLRVCTELLVRCSSFPGSFSKRDLLLWLPYTIVVPGRCNLQKQFKKKKLAWAASKPAGTQIP